MISLNKPWAPDRYDFNNGTLVTEAKGVFPGPTSYIPWPSLTPLSLALATGYARGGFLARTTDGTYVIYAGTQTKLYKYISAVDAWLDVTRVSGGDYSVPDDEQWSFAQFGDQIVAVNANDDPQVVNITGGGNFVALAGSPPRARYVKTIGDQLWLGSLAQFPNQVFWSGRNNIEWWQPGSLDCDYQTFPDGGFVTGMTSLETGLIFQDSAIRRFVPDTSRALFQFARVEDQRGCLAPSSLVVPGKTAFYYSEDGFYATDGSGASAPIGADMIDGWFKDMVNADRLYAMVGAADPIHPRIIWLFPSIGNTSVLLDHAMCYDIVQKQWTHAEISASHLFAAATAGYSLESLDSLGYTLDTLPYSLDSRFFAGGSPGLAAFDSAYKMAFMSGPALAARIETSGFQAVPGGRGFVQGASLLTDASALTLSVGKKESVVDNTYTYGPAVAINAQGFSPQRSSGRVHRFRADIPAAATWSHVLGLEPQVENDGER